MAFEGAYGGRGKSELLTSCKFFFEASGRVQEKLILEISGLSVECPPAGGNQVFGSGTGGVKLRQATPTTQKFSDIVIKVVATDDIELYDWYRECNLNEVGSSQWAGERQLASIYAYDQDGNIKAQWDINNAYPCRYEGPEFQSGDEQMANESVTLVHEGVERVS